MPRGTKTVVARVAAGTPAPRAGIIATSDIKLTAMDNWCNRDCAVALVKIAGVQTIIISLYLDIKMEVQPPWLDDLMDMIDKKKFPIIMGIDSNAHSALYGPTNNARGNAFEDFIMQYGMKVENQAHYPPLRLKGGPR